MLLIILEYGMHFIKASSRITVALNHSAKLLFNVSDDLKMFSTVIPSLVSHTLMTLSKREFSARDIEKLEEVNYSSRNF